MNPTIIAKYRKVDWFFAVYEGIELKAIYKLTPAELEPFFVKCEEKLRGGATHLNNPKIPLKFVIGRGKLYYKVEDHINLPPLDE